MSVFDTPGAAKHAEMVRFGPGPDDFMPLSWAERMLADLAKERPVWFGKAIAGAALNSHNGE